MVEHWTLSRLGTGTNACYFEDVEKIHTIKDRSSLPAGATEMIINTEWGALGRGLPICSKATIDLCSKVNTVVSIC